MNKKLYNYIFVAAMVALSFYVGIRAYSYPKTDIEQGFGPGIYPILLAVVIFLLAMFLLVSTIMSKDKGNEKIKDLDITSLKMPIGFWVLLIFFCVSFETLGMLLSSFLYLLISTRVAFKLNWKNSIKTAVIVPLLIWLVFYIIMKVPLPIGTIWNIFN